MIGRRTVLAAAPALALAAGAARAATTGADRLFDAHAHLISTDVDRFPRPADSRPRPAQGTPTAEAVLSWWDANGVEAGACVQHKATYGFDDSYILACGDAHADRLSPVVVLDAQDPATPAKLRAWTRTHGLAGVRLTGRVGDDGSAPWLDSEAALATWAAAHDLGLLVDLMPLPNHYSAAAMAKIAALSDRFDRCTVVVDHVGWPTLDPDGKGVATLAEFRPHKQLFFKLTTINLNQALEAGRDPKAMVREMVETLGPDRLCWGSDIGNSEGAYAEMVARIKAATTLLTPAQRQAVLHDTGKAIYRRRRA